MMTRKARRIALCAAFLLALLCGSAMAEETAYAAMLRETYPELMQALGGETFGGEVLDISATDRHGAAVVRQDGALELALLARGDGGWVVTDRTRGLFDAVDPGTAVSLWYNGDEYGGEHLSVTMSDAVMLYFEARQSDGETGLWLDTIECGDPALAMQALPELTAADGDHVSFAAVMWDAQRMRVSADVYTDQGETKFSGCDFVDPTEFARPIEAVSLRDTLAWMGEVIASRDGPDFIPTDGSAIALPQPQLANFKKGLKFDVYTGPGTNYLREADGKATVSTNDWLYVFGEENGWLLIEYHVRESLGRFGWIRASAREAGVSVPALTWAGDEAIYPGRTYVTTDPLNTCAEIYIGEEKRCVRLATLGEWSYIEIEEGGRPLRAFIDTDMLTIRRDWADGAIVVDQEAALYADAQGRTQTATLYRGAALDLLEESGDMLRVCLQGAQDSGICGWVHAAQARKGAWPGDADAVADTLFECARLNLAQDLHLYAMPSEEGGVTSSIEFSTVLIRLAEVDGFAYVREPDNGWNQGFLPARMLMPTRQAYIDMAWRPEEGRQVHVAAQGAVLRAQADENGEAIAALTQGMILYVLGEEDGWVFVDSGASGFWHDAGAHLRGYLPAACVQGGLPAEGTVPVMRLDVPQGQALYVDSLEMYSGAQCLLRAVGADGASGLCFFDLRMPQALVPMAWLQDTGRRVEDDFEAMGTPAMVVSQNGEAQVPYWDSAASSAQNAAGIDTIGVGETVTKLSENGAFAVVALPGMVGAYVMRTENLK